MSTNYVSAGNCDHGDCDHELKHCSKCDVVYCDKCSEEWPKYKYQPHYPVYPSYPYYPITYPSGRLGNTWTATNTDNEVWQYKTTSNTPDAVNIPTVFNCSH